MFPATVTPYVVGMWFCFGFVTGFGWSLASWIVSRLLSRV